MTNQLSKFFTDTEFCYSSTGTKLKIDNSLPANLVKNAKLLCSEVLDCIRGHYGKPVHLSSGYRSPALNEAVGGAINSYHTKALAADLTVMGVTTKQVFNDIISGKIKAKDGKTPLKDIVDQVIYENKNGDDWVHTQIAETMENPRKQFLVASFNKRAKAYYQQVCGVI